MAPVICPGKPVHKMPLYIYRGREGGGKWKNRNLSGKSRGLKGSWYCAAFFFLKGHRRRHSTTFCQLDRVLSRALYHFWPCGKSALEGALPHLSTRREPSRALKHMPTKGGIQVGPLSSFLQWKSTPGGELIFVQWKGIPGGMTWSFIYLKSIKERALVTFY